jgi:hypothetical protein
MSNISNYDTFDKDMPWLICQVEEFYRELELSDFDWPNISLVGGGCINFYDLPDSTDVLALSLDQAFYVTAYRMLTREDFETVLERADEAATPGDCAGYAYHAALAENAKDLAYFDSRDVSWINYTADEAQELYDLLDGHMPK